MNSTAAISIVLKHLIPALQSIQRELQEAESKAASIKPSQEQPVVVGRKERDAPDKLYKLSEAASFLNVRKATLYQFTSSKRIPYYKNVLGKSLLVAIAMVCL
jgi:excisionase family DNA binding protein